MTLSAANTRQPPKEETGTARRSAGRALNVMH
jgi:hypothetical protein